MDWLESADTSPNRAYLASAYAFAQILRYRSGLQIRSERCAKSPFEKSSRKLLGISQDK